MSSGGKESCFHMGQTQFFPVSRNVTLAIYMTKFILTTEGNVYKEQGEDN